MKKSKKPREVWCVWDAESGPAWFLDEARAREVAARMGNAGWPQKVLHFTRDD